MQILFRKRNRVPNIIWRIFVSFICGSCRKLLFLEAKHCLIDRLIVINLDRLHRVFLRRNCNIRCCNTSHSHRFSLKKLRNLIQQSLRLKWFCQPTIGTDLISLCLVKMVKSSRQQQHRGIRQTRLTFNRSAEFKTIFSRH